MNKIKYYIVGIFLILMMIISAFFISKKIKKAPPELIKIALRDVGDKLLLAQKDSTSLILPVLELETNSFELSFSKPLALQPDDIIKTIKRSFRIAQLPDNYRVEVNECDSNEVAYSYFISPLKEKTLVPCSGRLLPESCYKIQVVFLAEKSNSYMWYVILLTSGFLLCFITFLTFKKNKIDVDVLENSHVSNHRLRKQLGSFYFYPEENKLVKASNEISLSRKECEILSIFVNNPNQIIKRDDLTKQVWEDHGVFVGRSLDTYISKLRKKLKADTSIKLTNIHGVGYKLEIDT